MKELVSVHFLISILLMSSFPLLSQLHPPAIELKAIAGSFSNVSNLSWKLPVSNAVNYQTAYQIRMSSDSISLSSAPDLWDSKKVISMENLWVPYIGVTLLSRSIAYWQVRYWNEDNEASEWSSVSSVELGLLTTNQWLGDWVFIPDERKSAREIIPVQVLSKTINIREKPVKARIYITALGNYEATINDQKIGDAYMTPGWTPYDVLVPSQFFDLTDILEKGANCLSVTLSEGWYAGKINTLHSRTKTHLTPKMICQLEISYSNGEKQTIVSDSSWKGTHNGPVRYASIYDGEYYDENYELPNCTSFETDNWKSVSTITIDSLSISPKSFSNIKNQEILKAVSFTKTDRGSVIFDFGQNFAGVPFIKLPAIKDSLIYIEYGEMLIDSFRLYNENYRSATSQDYYKPASTDYIEWQPTFTYHGFRYVEIIGFDPNYEPELTWCSGVVRHTCFDKTLKFSCSNEKLNKLSESVLWSMKSNFFDVPTDCPQRDERLGWTGDVQFFCPVALMLGDVDAFFYSWLKSMRLEQLPKGQIPWVIPNVKGETFSAGWADVAAILPWEIYQKNGDKKVLSENFEMIQNLINFYISNSEDFIPKVFSFGDWLDGIPSSNAFAQSRTDTSLIATAYFARTVEIAAKIAKELNKEDEYNVYVQLHSKIRKSFAVTFFNSNGELIEETQTGYLLSLVFRLLPEEMQEKVFYSFLGLLKSVGNQLQTGFIGNSIIDDVLVAYGHEMLMLDLILDSINSPWIKPIDLGATTIWEQPNGYTNDKGFISPLSNSFNHYTNGSIGQFLYEEIGGLKVVEPGYKKFHIYPKLIAEIDSVHLSYYSNYGEISSTYKDDVHRFAMTIKVPPNTTAMLTLPFLFDSKVSIRDTDGPSISGELVENNSSSFTTLLKAGTYKVLIKK